MLDDVVGLDSALNTKTNRNTTYDPTLCWVYGSLDGVGVVEPAHRCFPEWECGRDEDLGDVDISEGAFCR